MVSDLLHHLEADKSVRVDGIHMRVLRKLEGASRELQACQLDHSAGEGQEQIILGNIMWHVLNLHDQAQSAYGFIKSSS